MNTQTDEYQENIKCQIKSWLKAERKDYKNLADICFVTESTVRNWMAKKKIPKAKLQLLMAAINKESGSSPVQAPPTSTDDVSALIEVLKRIKKNTNADFNQSVYALVGALILK